MQMTISIVKEYEMDADQIQEYLETHFGYEMGELDFDDQEVMEEYLDLIREDAQCCPEEIEDLFSQPLSVYADKHVMF